MKKIGIQISVLMGLTLSFFESLIGMLSSGHFNFPGWIVSFLVSLVISLLIGFLVPVKPVTDYFTVRKGMQPGKLSTRMAEAMVSNCIFTPVMTVIMVTIAWFQATSHGAKLPYLPMLISSLIICFIAGYILIFIFQPMYMRLVFEKNGIPYPPPMMGTYGGTSDGRSPNGR